MTLYGLKMLLLTGDESIEDDVFYDMANLAKEFIKSNQNAIRPSLPPWGALRVLGPGHPARYTVQPTPQYTTCTPSPQKASSL